METRPATLGDDFRIGSDQQDTLLGYPFRAADGSFFDPNDELGNDRIYGLGGGDNIESGGGNDTLYGDAGNDIVRANDGDDRAVGGDGDDALAGDAGDDLLVGGAGEDSLSGLSDDDRVYGGDGNDTLTGGAAVIFETNSEDAQFAGGRDKLYGGAGNDYIYGGNDNDILVGGAGRDWLRGGQGADRFMFRDDFGDDRVADFQPGRDILDFRGQGLSAASFAYSVVDALGDGTADDLLITVAGLGSVALIRTDQSDLTATNLVF